MSATIDQRRQKVFWATSLKIKPRALQWLKINTGDKNFEADVMLVVTEAGGVATISFGWLWAWVTEGTETKQPMFHLDIKAFIDTFPRNQPLDLLLSCRKEALQDKDIMGRLWGCDGHGVETIPENEAMTPFLQWYVDKTWGPIEVYVLTGRFGKLPFFSKEHLPCRDRVVPMDELRSPLKRAEYIAEAVLLWECSTIYHRPQRAAPSTTPKGSMPTS